MTLTDGIIDNSITNEGATAIKEALRLNSTLITLDLSDNPGIDHRLKEEIDSLVNSPSRLSRLSSGLSTIYRWS